MARVDETIMHELISTLCTLGKIVRLIAALFWMPLSCSDCRRRLGTSQVGRIPRLMLSGYSMATRIE